jgi:hypothetical protein
MKGIELTPENKAMQRAGLAFAIASKFGRRGKTFEEELGEASGVVAEKSAEVEKLDREIKRQQALMNLDLKKTQRAEKKGQWDMMEKYGDKADSRAEKLYGLEAAKANTMADIQLKKDKMAQDERLGMAQIAATRAGQTDFNRQVLANKIDEAVAQFTASKGRAPNPQELAQIKGSASEAAAKILKPADPFGAPKLNVAVENAVSTRMGKDKVYNDLALALLTADPKDKPAIQARMDARESQIRSEVQTNAGAAPGAGAGGTGKPSLQEFLAKARAANPKVSDADLTAYYNKTYGQ